MGSAHSDILSGRLSPDDIERLTNETFFTASQIVKLMQLYQTLTRGSSKIQEEEFITKLKIPNKHIGSIMYQMLDTDGSGDIDFQEFLFGLNAFLPQAPIDDKIRLCFRAYDSDGSEAVSKEEVEDIINISLINNPFVQLNRPELEQLLDDLFDEYDEDRSGELTYPQFEKMVRRAPGILECFEFDMENVDFESS